MGSTGVLVNITGGDDLTLGEVNQVSDIVHEAAGDQAEIIFGAVNDSAMEGEIRVTVIATGFDKTLDQDSTLSRSSVPGVLQFPQRSAAAAGGAAAMPAPAPVQRPLPEPDAQQQGEVSEMEIPTFIRRQMD